MIFGFESNLLLEAQAKLFVAKANRDNNCITSYFIQFFRYQIENRVDTNHITSATLKNYFKAAKLFCVMNDVVLNWLKITKGLPIVKYYSVLSRLMVGNPVFIYFGRKGWKMTLLAFRE